MTRIGFIGAGGIAEVALAIVQSAREGVPIALGSRRRVADG